MRLRLFAIGVATGAAMWLLIAAADQMSAGQICAVVLAAALVWVAATPSEARS